MEAEYAVAFSLERLTAIWLKKLASLAQNHHNRIWQGADKFGASLTMDTICNESDEAILACEISDEALEAAAAPTSDGAAAMSFPNAPTVSILIICCGNG
ncbi:MAG TPA: hypothetical protein VFN63_16495 [Pseudolabrys sp.]|nr:hypothetical protein [Pseudolabrys sp.]